MMMLIMMKTTGVQSRVASTSRVWDCQMVFSNDRLLPKVFPRLKTPWYWLNRSVQESPALWWWSTSTSRKSFSPLTRWSKDWRLPKSTTILRRSSRGILSSGRHFISLILRGLKFASKNSFPGKHAVSIFASHKLLSSKYIKRALSLLQSSTHCGFHPRDYVY